MSNSVWKKALAGLRKDAVKGVRWRLIDARQQVLGRIASQISVILQGKDKPTYSPNRDDGDVCIVVNAADVVLTGKKVEDKVYKWHTGYVGHLKERTVKEQLQRDPTEILRKAVERMLPRNRLHDDRMRKLRLFAGPEHPFPEKRLETYIPPPRNIRELRPREKRNLKKSQSSPSTAKDST